MIPPKEPPKLDLDAAEKAVEIASEALAGLCKARWESPEAWAKAWHWEIPANETMDTDLKIGNAIGLCKDLIAEVRRLRGWKSEQMQVWGPVSDYAQKHGRALGIQLGESISERVLEILKERATPAQGGAIDWTDPGPRLPNRRRGPCRLDA